MVVVAKGASAPAKKKVRRRAKPKVVASRCPRPDGCPIGEDPEHCTPDLAKTCSAQMASEKQEQLIQFYRMGQPVSQQPTPKTMTAETTPSSSGYSWTIKDLIPLVITVCTCAFGIFQVYNALTIRMTAMEKDMEFLKESTTKELTYIKASVQSINEKLDGITKSNESVKLQLNDLTNSIVKRGGK